MSSSKALLTIDDKKSDAPSTAGIYRTLDLTLRHGDFVIPDAWVACDAKDQQKLTLHQRLAVQQPFAYSATNVITRLNEVGLEDFFSSSSPLNYVNATLGFVVSAQPSTTDSSDQAKDFFTIAIDDKKLLIKGRGELQGKHHSETLLFDCLNNEATLQGIIDNLVKLIQKRYSNHLNFIIYAVVLDVHSTRDACTSCQDAYYEQMDFTQPRSFLRLMQSLLIKMKFKFDKAESLPLKVPLFHFAVRTSFDMPYGRATQKKPNHRISSIENSIQGFLGAMDTFILSVVIECMGIFCRDISKFNNDVLLIDNSAASKYLFNTKASFHQKGLKQEFLLLKQTIFATSKEFTPKNSKEHVYDEELTCESAVVKL